MTALLAPARSPAVPMDLMDGVTLRAAVELTGDGRLILICGAGCTEVDARDLCALIVGGEIEVTVRTT